MEEREAIHLDDIPERITDYKHLIYLAFRGSIAHGTYVPNEEPDSCDDIDLLGVYVADEKHYLGLSEPKRTIEIKEGPFDCVIYELKHFVNLCLKSNPSIIGTLWINDEHRIITHEWFQRFIDNKHLFVNKRHTKNAFRGYAKKQQKRMEVTLTQTSGMCEKRRELVQKYGYDTKMASHCIRLLRMCLEFLEDEYLYVDRTHIDAPELVDIKRGKWCKEGVLYEATHLQERINEAYEKSTLPEEPEREGVEAILVQILKESCWGVVMSES